MTSVIRSLAVSLVLGGMVLIGFWQLTLSRDRQLVRELQAMNADMTERLAARQAMVERLSRTRRVAHVQVTEQLLDEDDQVTETTFSFIELDDNGAELARQEFNVPGDVLFIDAWAVKFAMDDIAHGHPMRGRSIVLLNRIYSDHMAPRDGLAIDTPGAIPPGYAVGEIGRFEQQVWENFWDIADDPALAEAMGVRVAQGEAVYRPVTVGATYELTVDAVGGMNFVPLDDASGFEDPSSPDYGY